MSPRARIKSVGIYTPPTLVTNQDTVLRLGRAIPEAIEKNLGIQQHYVTGPNLSSADMALKAAEQALVNGQVPAEELDLVVVVTDTPEYITPPTSSVIQGRLGAIHAGTFDVNAACSGFAAGLNIASRMMGYDDTYQKILVVATYNMSKWVDENNEFYTSVFADGAGAVVLEATDEDAGYLATEIWADGKYSDYLGVFVGGTRYPATVENIEQGQHRLRTVTPYPPDINLANWPRLVRNAVKRGGLEIDDIDHILFTQINRSTIEIVMNELGIPMEKTTCVMDRYGYTGSACLPMALYHALEAQKIKRGDVVVFLGSGVGAAMVADVFKW